MKCAQEADLERLTKLRTALSDLESALFTSASAIVASKSVDGVSVSYYRSDAMKLREEMLIEIRRLESIIGGVNPFMSKTSVIGARYS